MPKPIGRLYAAVALRPASRAAKAAAVRRAALRSSGLKQCRGRPQARGGAAAPGEGRARLEPDAPAGLERAQLLELLRALERRGTELHEGRELLPPEGIDTHMMPEFGREVVARG